MIGITNVGGGGGMAYAYIGVVYDAGATVTCTDGNKTYRAKDTSGLYVFPVPYAATWIVTATDGTNTKSESVVIDSLWQDVVVDITFYDGTIFNNGNQFLSVTGGWSFNDSFRYGSRSSSYIPEDVSTIGNNIAFSPFSSTGNRCCYVSTANAIDFTGVTSITITFNSFYSSGGGGFAIVYLSQNSSDYTNVSYGVGFSYGPNISLVQTANVSASGSRYVNVGIYSSIAYPDIAKIKLNYS